MPELSEDEVQGQCVDWLKWAQYSVTFTHTMNEGKRGWKSQAKLKRLGVRAGWPDMTLVYHGAVLFCEFKTRTGPITQAQKECHADLKYQGFPVAVIRSFDEFKAVVEAWCKHTDLNL